jgi:archaellum component FlaC
MKNQPSRKLLRHLKRNCNTADPEAGENEKIGEHFIELWKEDAKQRKNLLDTWGTTGKLISPFKDIIEELTKTVKRIKKPYDELERQIANSKTNTPVEE